MLCYVRWLRNTLPTMGNTWQTSDKYLFVSFVSVWLLCKMTGHDLSANAILDLILRLPLPSDVAGHMLLFALRQQHCLPRYEAMFYLKSWCYRCGLAQPGEVQTPAETLVSRTRLVLVRPTLASALVHLGFPRCFAVHLPISIGAGNRTLWRELLFKGMLEGFQQLVAFRATFSFHFQIHFSLSISYSFQFHFHFITLEQQKLKIYTFQRNAG